MNTEIKSAEEILYKKILADSEKQIAEHTSLTIKNPSFEEIVKNPTFQMHIAAMEEYASQFKQLDISEDVRKAAEKYLTDLGIANTGMFTSRTMLKTFEDGAEWQRQQHIPTIDGSIILNIAASLVRNKLSEFIEDWKFSKSTPVRDKRKIINAIIKHNEFQNRLALELKKLL